MSSPVSMPLSHAHFLSINSEYRKREGSLTTGLGALPGRRGDDCSACFLLNRGAVSHGGHGPWRWKQSLAPKRDFGGCFTTMLLLVEARRPHQGCGNPPPRPAVHEGHRTLAAPHWPGRKVVLLARPPTRGFLATPGSAPAPKQLNVSTVFWAPRSRRGGAAEGMENWGVGAGWPRSVVALPFRLGEMRFVYNQLRPPR